jgi:hypothetical protein
MNDSINAQYEEVKKSKDPEIINNFIIELSKNPIKENLRYLDVFIFNLDKGLFEKIKLNLIYAIGEIGNKNPLPNEYLQFLYNTYYISDRWIRAEIIHSIEKASKTSPLDKYTFKIISTALRDDYIPVKMNALKIVLNFKKIPKSILKSLFHVLNSKNSEVLEVCERVLEKFSLDSNFLFNALDELDNYKILKPRAIRLLFSIPLKSIFNLESFRELVLNSQWDENYVKNYLEEIDIFEKILTRNL